MHSKGDNIMNTSVNTTNKTERAADIAIVGGGPAALVLAIALARRGIRTTVFERDVHPEMAPRFNPDRSYTVDISGHGQRALHYIDASAYFDARLLPFKGIKVVGQETQELTEPGWTGSRGDIVRALMAAITEQYQDWVAFEFESQVTEVDVQAGVLTYIPKSGVAVTRPFDFIIGGDGAGSVVRNAMLEQIPGFTVETKSLPNYCTMIELDRVGAQMDPHYLHGLSNRPFCAAGAIKGEHGPGSERWFCAVGTRTKLAFASAEEVRQYFRQRCPRILELASEEAIAAFAQRTCYHIGRKLTCSQLYGGKVVLLGDAAGPFPPIGQGVNAAMESAMMLDLCIGEVGYSPTALHEAARRYNAKWKPEVDAVSWISEKSLFENPFHTLRSIIAMKLGLHVAEQAKSADTPYSEVRRQAERRWPLWV
jgi:2-polyprenyl-6-methoxyphenol hydroxylase-like FAD-dependent oxidoreductase